MPALPSFVLLTALGIGCPPEETLVPVVPPTPGSGAYRVGRIRFEGNTRTCDRLLRDRVVLDEGDILNTRELELSLRAIAGLGFVRLAGPVELTASEAGPHHVDVTVKVEERTRPGVSAGGTLGGIEGGSLEGSFSTPNLFGCGERVELALQGGDRVQRYAAAFEKPYLFGGPWTGGLGAERRSLEVEGSRERDLPAYDVDRSAAWIEAAAPLGPLARVSARYSFAAIRSEPGTALDDDEPPAGRFGRRHESELSVAAERDTAGGCWEPRRGTRLRASLSLAGGPLGGDVRLVESRAEAVAYLPHLSRTTFAARLQVAGLFAFGESAADETPFDRLYALGGPGELRGYQPREVGPRDAAGRVAGGRRLLLANAEYAAVVASRLSVVAFLDAGHVFGGGAPEPALRDRGARWHAAAGAELRLRLPLVEVPLRLIWAVRLPPAGVQGGSEPSLALGTTFGP